MPLFLQVHTATGATTMPVLPPWLTVWTPGGSKVLAREMPISRERFTHPGLFYYDLFLDASFGTGVYTAVYAYTAGAFLGLEEDNFEIVPGGHGDGAVTSAYFYERPEATFVVHGTETGKILPGRNPSL